MALVYIYLFYQKLRVENVIIKFLLPYICKDCFPILIKFYNVARYLFEIVFYIKLITFFQTE